MLIGVSGTICSGKSELARYLVSRGFQHVVYAPDLGVLELCLEKKSESVESEELEVTELQEKEPSESQEKEVTESQEKESPESHELEPISHELESNLHELELKSQPPPTLIFSNIDALLDHVTVHWRTHYVLLPLNSSALLDALAKRPFFLHVAMDAPITLRHTRYSAQHPARRVSFHEFAVRSDHNAYFAADPVAPLVARAQVKHINTCGSVPDLVRELDRLNLCDATRLRPSWDGYFMRLADLAALRSNCMKRRVGCVIVRQNRVVATGYNGTPRHLTNCNDGGCERCNHGHGSGAALQTCLCLHAEENALLEAGRDRIGSDSVLYCNTCPCLTCLIKIVQAGVTEVVYAQSYSMDTLSKRVMSEASVRVRQFLPPKDGIAV